MSAQALQRHRTVMATIVTTIVYSWWDKKNINLIMSFERVPEDFMKGVFLAPHNFNDPENPEHGEYVNLQLRNDLYYSTLD